VINGHAVHFDGFGTFHLKMLAKVAKTKDEVDTKLIRRLTPEFIWHKELRDECKRTRHEINQVYSEED
jgi:nucleoid DNA-binding protein